MWSDEPFLEFARVHRLVIFGCPSHICLTSCRVDDAISTIMSIYDRSIRCRSTNGRHLICRMKGRCTCNILCGRNRHFAILAFIDRYLLLRSSSSRCRNTLKPTRSGRLRRWTIEPREYGHQKVCFQPQMKAQIAINMTPIARRLNCTVIPFASRPTNRQARQVPGLRLIEGSWLLLLNRRYRCRLTQHSIDGITPEVTHSTKESGRTTGVMDHVCQHDACCH